MTYDAPLRLLEVDGSRVILLSWVQEQGFMDGVSMTLYLHEQDGQSGRLFLPQGLMVMNRLEESSHETGRTAH